MPAALASTIRGIQDLMRADPGVDGDAERLAQIVRLLFLKFWDRHEHELERSEPNFASPLVDVAWPGPTGPRHAPDLRWRAWAVGPAALSGDALLRFVDDTLFPALRGLDLDDPDEPRRRRRALVRSVFADAAQRMTSGALLRAVVDRLDALDAAGPHALGDLYEHLLRDLGSAGNAGEFYTPRALVEFAVAVVDPRPGDVVLDPACGTGGFLACAVDHLRRRGLADPARLAAAIRGVEKKPLPHQLALTNLLVHGLDDPAHIVRGNALARPFAPIPDDERADVIVTNPPFGGMEEDLVADHVPAALRSRETADLFVARVVELLRDGGRAAVVLPDGFLFGRGVKARIKDRLLTACDLHTIVRLPPGVFAPYTPIRTNLLCFTRGRPTREVWYHDVPPPAGARGFTRTRPLRAADLAPVHAWWTDRRAHAHAWRVPIADLRARDLDLDLRSPAAAEPPQGDPDVLFAAYERAAAAAADARADLRAALADAFIIPKPS